MLGNLFGGAPKRPARIANVDPVPQYTRPERETLIPENTETDPEERKREVVRKLRERIAITERTPEGENFVARLQEKINIIESGKPLENGFLAGAEGLLQSNLHIDQGQQEEFAAGLDMGTREPPRPTPPIPLAKLEQKPAPKVTHTGDPMINTGVSSELPAGAQTTAVRNPTSPTRLGEVPQQPMAAAGHIQELGDVPQAHFQIPREFVARNQIQTVNEALSTGPGADAIFGSGVQGNNPLPGAEPAPASNQEDIAAETAQLIAALGEENAAPAAPADAAPTAEDLTHPQALEGIENEHANLVRTALSTAQQKKESYLSGEITSEAYRAFAQSVSEQLEETVRSLPRPRNQQGDRSTRPPKYRQILRAAMRELTTLTDEQTPEEHKGVHPLDFRPDTSAEQPPEAAPSDPAPAQVEAMEGVAPEMQDIAARIQAVLNHPDFSNEGQREMLEQRQAALTNGETLSESEIIAINGMIDRIGGYEPAAPNYRPPAEPSENPAALEGDTNPLVKKRVRPALKEVWAAWRKMQENRTPRTEEAFRNVVLSKMDGVAHWPDKYKQIYRANLPIKPESIMQPLSDIPPASGAPVSLAAGLADRPASSAQERPIPANFQEQITEAVENGPDAMRIQMETMAARIAELEEQNNRPEPTPAEPAAPTTDLEDTTTAADEPATSEVFQGMTEQEIASAENLLLQLRQNREAV